MKRGLRNNNPLNIRRSAPVGRAHGRSKKTNHLAFPKNKENLEEWLMGEDEYRNW